MPIGNNLAVVIASILNNPIVVPLFNVAICFELLKGAPPMSVPVVILTVSVDFIESTPLLIVKVPVILCVLFVVADALKVTSLIVPIVTILNGFIVGASKI